MGIENYEEKIKLVKQVGKCKFKIEKGFVPNMNVPAYFFCNGALEPLMFDEYKSSFSRADGGGGFLPAMKQLANVAALPGIVNARQAVVKIIHRLKKLEISIGMPDVHAGYGFAIGNIAAFDMSDPEAVVSPGGVGFDINCGVRLVRTNLHENDVQPVKEQLAQEGFLRIHKQLNRIGQIRG